MCSIDHFWPPPWRYEPEGYNGGPCVKDANGQVMLALFWPLHPAEETAVAELAMNELGAAIAAGSKD